MYQDEQYRFDLDDPPLDLTKTQAHSRLKKTSWEQLSDSVLQEAGLAPNRLLDPTPTSPGLIPRIFRDPHAFTPSVPPRDARITSLSKIVIVPPPPPHLPYNAMIKKQLAEERVSVLAITCTSLLLCTAAMLYDQCIILSS